MRIGKEIMPFDPASHTIGVHNVALHTAIMAVKAGIPVDLPLVSGAALGHDVGKFGCRGEDAARIPYLHYYYTWQWFSQLGLEDIGYISANHSTWDLEFENLPIESLLLIYADFRVRGTKGDDGKEQMAIYSLDEAYEMVFSKLYNMTPEKKQRYQTVYFKLQDFQEYLFPNKISDRQIHKSQKITYFLVNRRTPHYSLRKGLCKRFTGWHFPTPFDSCVWSVRMNL